MSLGDSTNSGLPVISKMITIAIDGFSSTGKSSLAKRIAHVLGFVYVDTGAMYRAVALHALRKGWIGPNGEWNETAIVEALPSLKINFSAGLEGTNRILLNGEAVEDEIRSMAVSQAVSKVSAIVPVRRAMVAQQQAMAHSDRGLVMDGRDIGTVVFPQAELKLFMTARPEVRANRRFAELRSKGIGDVSWQEVFDNLAQRDAEDSARLDSPLLCAPDARILDNSDMDFDQTFALALSWARERMEEKERI